LNLLLVDDDRVSIDILAEYIKPHLTQIDEIFCAYNGQDAFDIIISVKPNIIVTDIKMPDVSGIDLAKKIRAVEAYEPIIIFISGYSDFNYARDALKLNVTDYILKPIDQEELITKINAISNQNAKPKNLADEDIIETVKKYISLHLDESLTLIAIADHFHYNPSYLGRLIKKNIGSSFSNYVLKLRVLKAESLLINTTKPIKQISLEVGFRDPEHFTKRFKKIVGVTPSSFRKNY